MKKTQTKIDAQVCLPGTPLPNPSYAVVRLLLRGTRVFPRVALSLVYLHPSGLARHPLHHDVQQVVAWRRELRLRGGVDRDPVPVRPGHERRDGQHQQPLVHGVAVRRERRRVHGHLEVGIGDVQVQHGNGELEAELGPVRHPAGGDGRHVDLRPVGGALRGEVGRREALDAHLGGEVDAGEVVGGVGVAAGHEHGGVGQQRAGGVVHARDGGRGQRAEPRAPRLPRRVQERAQHRLPAEAPAGAALGRAVQHEQVAGGQDQQVAHGACHGHLVGRPPGAGLQRVDARAVPESVVENVGLAELEGVLGGAAADDDLGAEHVAAAEVEGEERGHAGGGVVPAPAGEGREVADDLAGPVVEHDGAVVGEDEQSAVGEEVDERVQIVLDVVGGVTEQLHGFGGGVRLALRRDELVAERAPAAEHDGAPVREDLLRPVPAHARIKACRRCEKSYVTLICFARGTTNQALAII
jgi:hypothetical protein